MSISDEACWLPDSMLANDNNTNNDNMKMIKILAVPIVSIVVPFFG